MYYGRKYVYYVYTLLSLGFLVALMLSGNSLGQIILRSFCEYFVRRFRSCATTPPLPCHHTSTPVPPHLHSRAAVPSDSNAWPNSPDVVNLAIADRHQQPSSCRAGCDKESVQHIRKHVLGAGRLPTVLCSSSPVRRPLPTHGLRFVV